MSNKDLKDVRIEENEGDVYHFSVFRGSRLWKRNRETSRWQRIEVDGSRHLVPRRRRVWLDELYARRAELPRVRRFPRTKSNKALIWKTLARFNPSAVRSTTWLIDSFLPEGGIQLFVGERGSFKSTFMLFAAAAVASGGKILGRKTIRTRVLYLDYENPPDIIKQRSADLNLGLPENERLVLWDRFGDKPIPKPGDQLLEAIVRECKTETGHGPWIIFDSWSSLLKDGEGGELTGQSAPVYLQLRKLADLGATISVLDHTRKYDKNTTYGSLDKEAKVDVIHKLLILDDRSESTIIRVES
jgi:AAA domain